MTNPQPHPRPHFILALTGPKGSGKSTLAKALISSNPNFIRQRFAEPIKLMLSTLLAYQGDAPDLIERRLDGDLKETPTPYLENNTPRHAMQTLGTEWRDMLSRELWSGIWQRGVITSLLQGKSIVVDDMRFLHEAECVSNLEGLIIRIDRIGCQPGPHPSENEYLKIRPDLILTNTEGDPSSMLIQLQTYLEQIR